MRGELIGNFFRYAGRGFSTLEVLIAFAIVTLSLVGAVSISFGAQSAVLDGQLYLGAISHVEDVFEKTQSDLPESFNYLVQATSTIDGFYQENFDVLNITPCVKKVTVAENWKQESIPKDLYFSQIFTSPLSFEKIAEPCSGEELYAQDWEDYVSHNFSIGIDDVTDVDFVDGLVFVSSNTGTTTDSDLFIFDSKKSYEKLAELDIGSGIFAIDATREYLYAVTDATSSQFVIIDVGDPSTPTITVKRNLFGVDPFGSYPQGRSIKYFDKKVYIGTKETAGPEFHIFDVSNPSTSFQVGFIEITHNINKIEVRDDMAYLATSADTKELIVIDVSNPSGMFEVGSFNAGTSAVNDRDATAIYLLGNSIYLGRKRGAVLNPEFYIIDVSISSAPQKVGDFNLALSGITSYVSEMVASSNLVFISTTDPSKGFFILDVSDLKNIKKVSMQSFDYPMPAIDFNGGIIYGIDFLNSDIYEIQKD